MFNFSTEERDRRWKKVRDAMEERGFECLILWGIFGRHGTLTVNLRYLSNVLTEGFLIFPLKGEPTFFRFWAGHEPTSWVGDNRIGHPGYSQAMSDRIKELHLENTSFGIGDLSGYCGELGFPHTTYVALSNNFPGATFEDATGILESARMIKSDEEIRGFELACEIGDKVIQAIADTAKAGVKDSEVRLTIMNTLFRNGCEPNSMLLYCSGKKLTHAGQGGWLTPAGEKTLEDGDVILAEFDAKLAGCFAQYNQPYSIGKPDSEWQQIFDIALESFNNGMNVLKPGITAGDLDEAFISPIKKTGCKHSACAFHGLGLSGLEEPIGSFPVQPSYKPSLSAWIEKGMIIEFEPHVITPEGKKGIHIGCPVLVTENGCRMLTKTWKPEFIVI